MTRKKGGKLVLVTDETIIEAVRGVLNTTYKVELWPETREVHAVVGPQCRFLTPGMLPFIDKVIAGKGVPSLDIEEGDEGGLE